MKTPKFSEGKIFQILKEAESGIAVPELCRKHGMSSASFYKWRSKYGGVDLHVRLIRFQGYLHLIFDPPQMYYSGRQRSNAG